jgi:DNA-binding GntR family transcriptional regulator
MENCVTILPRRRVVVNTLTLREIRDIYEIIGALESMALLKAAERFEEADMTFLAEMNEAMRLAIEAGDFDLYYEKNLAFHDVFLRHSGNDYLKRTVAFLKKRLYDFPRLEGFVKEWELASIGEHAELVALLRRRLRTEAAGHIRDVHWSYEVQAKFIDRYYAKASAL